LTLLGTGISRFAYAPSVSLSRRAIRQLPSPSIIAIASLSIIVITLNKSFFDIRTIRGSFIPHSIKLDFVHGCNL